jgi:hypothetical protein
MNELTLRDKAVILFRLGFLREQDRRNDTRIASRWHIYETVTQKTARARKQEPQRPIDNRSDRN